MNNDLINQTLLDRYSVHEHIGSGGMAEVYKVWDSQRAVFLAMKLLREDFAEDVIFLRRFEREAKILSELQHPHIVRFYGLEQSCALAFFLMDFVQGWSLRREIFNNRKSITFTQVLEIMRPVCSALNYAHNQGILHCDIKPGNILINHLGQVFMTDFGLSRMIDSASSTLVGIGTPNYMAPEQIRGLNPTPQTDIYALGVVMFELLTGGERPFTGERANESAIMGEKIQWEHLHLDPPSPKVFRSAITPELETVVFKCLEKLPENRYQTPLELLNGLEFGLTGLVDAHYMTGQGGSISPSSSLGSSDRKTRRFFNIPPTQSSAIGSQNWRLTWNFNTLMGLIGIVSLLLAVILVLSNKPFQKPTATAAGIANLNVTFTIPPPTGTDTPTEISIIAPEGKNTPEPSPTSTLIPSSTNTYTQVPSPTTKIVFLDSCGNLYHGEIFEYPQEICVFAVGASPQFVTIIFPSSPTYEIYLEIGNDWFDCMIPSGYPEKFYCSGPDQSELTNQQILLYRYDTRDLLAQGTIMFPLAETPTPTEKRAPQCETESCEDNLIPTGSPEATITATSQPTETETTAP